MLGSLFFALTCVVAFDWRTVLLSILSGATAFVSWHAGELELDRDRLKGENERLRGVLFAKQRRDRLNRPDGMH